MKYAVDGIEVEEVDSTLIGLLDHDSYEDAGLEESKSQPVFGLTADSGGIFEYLDWFYDGDVEFTLG